MEGMGLRKSLRAAGNQTQITESFRLEETFQIKSVALAHLSSFPGLQQCFPPISSTEGSR